MVQLCSKITSQRLRRLMACEHRRIFVHWETHWYRKIVSEPLCIRKPDTEQQTYFRVCIRSSNTYKGKWVSKLLWANWSASPAQSLDTLMCKGVFGTSTAQYTLFHLLSFELGLPIQNAQALLLSCPVSGLLMHDGSYMIFLYWVSQCTRIHCYMLMLQPSVVIPRVIRLVGHHCLEFLRKFFVLGVHPTPFNWHYTLIAPSIIASHDIVEIQGIVEPSQAQHYILHARACLQEPRLLATHCRVPRPQLFPTSLTVSFTSPLSWCSYLLLWREPYLPVFLFLIFQEGSPAREYQEYRNPCWYTFMVRSIFPSLLQYWSCMFKDYTLSTTPGSLLQSDFPVYSQTPLLANWACCIQDKGVHRSDRYTIIL